MFFCLGPSRKYLQIRLGGLHLDEQDKTHFDTQRVNAFFQVGGDLVDLVSIADSDYQINYAVPVEVSNNLEAQIAVQTPNKIK